jgi:hypothetical protein
MFSPIRNKRFVISFANFFTEIWLQLMLVTQFRSHFPTYILNALFEQSFKHFWVLFEQSFEHFWVLFELCSMPLQFFTSVTRGPFFTSTLAPRGEICPPGPGWSSPLGVNTLYFLEEWRGEQRILTPGDNFTPTGQNSPLGDNFAPGGQSLPLGVKLRMGVWSFGN